MQPFFAAMLPTWFVPNLMFCILIIMSATMDVEEMVLPMVLIFLFSLIQDFYYSQYVGITIIAMIVAMLAVIWLRRLANIENPFYLAFMVIAANLIYASVYWGIYTLISPTYSFMYMLFKLPEVAIPNVVVSFVALFIITRGIIQARRDGYFR